MSKYDTIIKKLEVHDQKFLTIVKKLDIHDRKFLEHDKKLANISDMVLKNTSDIEIIKENMVTKDEFRNQNQNIMSQLDHITTIVNKTREDHVFVIEWLKRLQVQCDHVS